MRLGGWEAGRRGGRLKGYQIIAFVVKGLFDYFFPISQMKYSAPGMIHDIIIPVIFICCIRKPNGDEAMRQGSKEAGRLGGWEAKRLICYVLFHRTSKVVSPGVHNHLLLPYNLHQPSSPNAVQNIADTLFQPLNPGRLRRRFIGFIGFIGSYGMSIGLLVYFIWTGLTGFYRIFLIVCQLPDEADRNNQPSTEEVNLIIPVFMAMIPSS